MNERACRRGSERGGFVLAVVVMMLFAISVAAATGYLVVNTEFEMARSSDEGYEALSVARGGLQRFVAEQLGVVGDSVSYAIGTGIAMVTSRKLAVIDADTDLYYLRSEATVSNIFTPASAARRTVGAYAYHHRRPLPNLAALISTSSSAGAGSTGVDGIVSGTDVNVPADCTAASGPDVAGVIARSSAVSSGTLQGSPASQTGGAYSTYTGIYNAVDLRWDILSNTTFPVDYENVQPNWASLPADSFPVVRMTGGSFTGAGWNGRGVLIVTGEFDSSSSFYWDGIVLAGAMDDIHEGHVRGMVVGGLAAANPKNPVVFEGGGWVRYYSCYVWDANESISYMQLLADTEIEVF